MEETLTEAIADYILLRKNLKLEPLQKKRDKALAAANNEAAEAAAQLDYNQAAQPFEKTYAPQTWLTSAATRAWQISLATHTDKFIHSDAKSSTMLVSEYTEDDAPYLVTAKIPKKTLDAAGNAAVLDVAKLLQIERQDDSLAKQLQNGHVDALRHFCQDENLLNTWKDGLLLGLSDSKTASHTLAKQLYFPVGNNEYHLLCPLFASTMAHELYNTVIETRFSEASKEIRDAKRKEEYHDGINVAFNGTALQNFGGSKPQNISQLNSQRHGNVYLLNAAPPLWKSQNKPPFAKESLLDSSFRYLIRHKLRDFRVFLENLPPEKNNVEIRLKRDSDYIHPIIDELFNLAAAIQSLVEHKGWTEDKQCDLQRPYQLWLDPYREDTSFTAEREKNDWQAVIAKDFASWFKKQIKSDKYLLGDPDSKHWQKLLSARLKTFEWATPKLEEIS
ncbi:MAG: type I-F CRISPR-associated protein Csy1 [Alteromonadaceae bacterium]|nr:MAG: type I-F CRISPR-associated protein Csy1 [Alteromonadaceae bacterium]